MKHPYEIAALEWQVDTDTVDGYVAEINSAQLSELTARFQTAGYQVSDSHDESGRHYLWVV